MEAKIAQLGADVLRQQAQTITDFNSLELENIIETMLTTLGSSKGVGLAAPQISESLAIVIIASKPNARYPDAPEMSPVVMLNPSFKILTSTMEKDWEGCLSVPSIRALVPRYRSIKVSYQDINANSVEIELNDFVARIFQHEYDHLQGLVFLDRVENNRDIIAESEFLQRYSLL